MTTSTRDTTTELVNGLRRDLANEFQALLAYTQWAARAAGPHRPQLRALFQGEIPDEQRHAQFLADMIIALGGDPLVEAAEVPPTDGNRSMLEATLEAERQAISDYVERARQAEAAGQVGLKVELENMVADETRHFQEVRMLLDGWSEPG
jgi:bacterioferritin